MRKSTCFQAAQKLPPYAWLSYSVPSREGLAIVVPYVRTVFVQTARVVLMRSDRWEGFSFGAWLASAAERMHLNQSSPGCSMFMSLHLSPKGSAPWVVGRGAQR